LFQSGPFKKYFWRKMNVIAYWIPSSSYDGRFRNWTQISDLALTFLCGDHQCSAVWLVAI
jgi:hypothetical protein